MSTAVKFIPAGKKVQNSRELTTNDAQGCVKFIERLAVAMFLAKSRVVETTIREYLSEHHPGTETSRLDFDEAVREIIRGKWNL